MTYEQAEILIKVLKAVNAHLSVVVLLLSCIFNVLKHKD